jgi:hypothetical protein
MGSDVRSVQGRTDDQQITGRENGGRQRVFLLSPANLRGQRGRLLLREDADFDLAIRLRRAGAPLGEVFTFVSSLYFRGKLAYSTAFAVPPADTPGAFVIAAGRGLISTETPVTLADLERIAGVPIDRADPRYRMPLERDCRRLLELGGECCEFVLLGSIASLKYLDPLFAVFGDRLLIPEEFVGRGDMSRGGLLLRCVLAGAELKYRLAGLETLHGPRPPRLLKSKSRPERDASRSSSRQKPASRRLDGPSAPWEG